MSSYTLQPVGGSKVRVKNEEWDRKGELNGFLEMRAHVLPHLVMPVGPFVAAFGTPVV
jgi:hypothetical protein